jgi:DNA polymerase delta subunit 3
MPDADEEPSREPTPIEQPPLSKPVELKEEVTVQGGRRRGKRQVMKKKTVKDEEGYLGLCSTLGPINIFVTNLQQ